MKSGRKQRCALGAVLLLAGCVEGVMQPARLDDGAVDRAPQGVALLTCTVDVSMGDMQCDPPSSRGNGIAANADVIVGGQHRYVRMANTPPVMTSTTWRAGVTVQNLMFQPMATENGTAGTTEGVRVFFVQEPTNGVEISNFDGESEFTGSAPQKYYQYSGAALGADGILSPGETSSAKTWQFRLNGATTFRFSVLISTSIPSAADSVHLMRVSAGDIHTCGDGADGRVYCWGYNLSGQVGDGTAETRSSPVAVIEPAGVQLSRVTAGGDHTCAEGWDRSIYCWGANTHSQLGVSGSASSRTPVQVTDPASGARLSNPAAGRYHTCADGSDGRIYCWGLGTSRQLGNGAAVSSSVPVPVTDIPGVTLSGVSGGAAHTCANGSDARVHCWGSVGSGLDDEGSMVSSTPVAVSAPAGGVTLSRVSAGVEHSCAIGSDGNVYCWGYNSNAQLGTGNTTSSSTPLAVSVQVSGLTFSRVAAGYNTTCAEVSDQRMYCWGAGDHGSLGNGRTNQRSVPVRVNLPGGVMLSGVSSANFRTCAVQTRGPTYCWGFNSQSQVGDGTSTDSYVPVRVLGTY